MFSDSSLIRSQLVPTGLGLSKITRYAPFACCLLAFDLHDCHVWGEEADGTFPDGSKTAFQSISRIVR